MNLTRLDYMNLCVQVIFVDVDTKDESYAPRLDESVGSSHQVYKTIAVLCRWFCVHACICRNGSVCMCVFVYVVVLRWQFCVYL